MHNILAPKRSNCVLGEGCQFYIKSIGLTLDDILRDELQLKTTLSNQPLSVKISAALTIIMFVGGLINSAFSLLTFANKGSRKVGCGVYLLASSITSILTISMFTVKFWFVVLTHISVSISLPVLQGGCVSIEPVLKLFVYWDTWLNACVAVERALHVFKGVNFDKKKSKRIAHWIVSILPFCIMATIIHEPLYRKIFEYRAEIKTVYVNETKGNSTAVYEYTNGTTESRAWCVTGYSHSVQDYNTAILFFHLIGPFIANLFSALFIIFGVARQRSVSQTRQTYIGHVREQLSEHKQLIISSMVLLVLSLPRLIISLLPGCVKVSQNLWLYLSGYFISFIPSMLIFVVFVLPSKSYMNAFTKTLDSWRRKTHQ